jgi:hypothetical protein
MTLVDLPANSFRNFPFRRTAEQFCLQLGHRLGAIGMLLNLTSWGLLYTKADMHWPLAIAFLCSDVGFCGAMIAWLLARREGRGGEAVGTLIFNLIFLILSLQMMIIVRLDVIRAAATQFFSPS